MIIFRYNSLQWCYIVITSLFFPKNHSWNVFQYYHSIHKFSNMTVIILNYTIYGGGWSHLIYLIYLKIDGINLSAIRNMKYIQRYSFKNQKFLLFEVSVIGQ